MARTVLDRVREAVRLQQVYNTMLRYSADAFFDRGVFGDWRRWWQERLWDPPEPLEPLSNPEKVRLMLKELGPTYVKVGQIASSRGGTLPLEWEGELSKLHSDVRQFAYEEVRIRVEQELGGLPEEVFMRFDPTPLAAASLAQAHRAALPDGQEVVVKVQRLDIETQVKADIGIMSNAARVGERRSVLVREIGVRGIVREFGSHVIDEMGYTIEAFNAHRLGQNLNDLPGLHVPEVYHDYSTKRVMTMEFIPGWKSSDAKAIDDAGLDRMFLATAATRGAVKMLLVDGFFHADPHPGNVLITPEGGGKINFIDLGMVGELTLQKRANLIQLLVVFQQRDVTGMSQALLTLSEPIRRHVNDKAFYRDFERRMSRFFLPGRPMSFVGVSPEALEVLRDNGYRLDSQLTLAIKALTQSAAIATVLVPREDRFDFIDRGVEITKGLLLEEVTTEKIASAIKSQATFMLHELAGELPSLEEATRKWLDQYRKGRFEVYVDTSGLEEQMETVRHITRVLTIGVIISGVVIGSAIAASITQSTEEPGFLADFANVFYTGAAIVAALLVIILLSRWRRAEREATEEEEWRRRLKRG